MGVPFIGRLSAGEWPTVLGSLFVAYFESIISLITESIPLPILQSITTILSHIHIYIFRIFISDSSNQIVDPEAQKIKERLTEATNAHELCKVHGLILEDHIVRTKDDYLLTLHRLPPKKVGSPVVYLHHGLLMCSDIWFVMNKRDQNLPYVLHEAGYDVWLGNNRGNKYSAKHLYLKPNSRKFWDFSMDEFAIYDIPDSINHILKHTSMKNLIYIGFSQGSAQAFASLSINSDLNNKVKLFIALAPAITPTGLHHKTVDTLIKTSPNFMYLLFGKRTLLPTASFWANTIYPPLFVKVIDASVQGLFDWRSANIDQDQKISSFKHLYSPTSVKCIVHWFQIIRNGKFQLFDENTSLTYSLSRSFQPANFPTRTNIKTPIRLIYGTIDSLVNIEEYLSLLPEYTTRAIPVENHEHLDIIWGKDVKRLVFPHIFNALKEAEDEDLDIKKVTNDEESI
ncbi:hypothetical protein WICMUC_001437 [Wickerhamomyces mucosus]|uniref:AB hydrolase-1 domain-containing protein n=1 Tax=Wickerhamomyces mucosus TaxID=1378264 RepID=A0A9P8PVM4_9ASCO|nr:hypothetical protein WICMUC_001437 [Wickerhamomyces mucosus]